jgi:CarD family transcriptional regulator
MKAGSAAKAAKPTAKRSDPPKPARGKGAEAELRVKARAKDVVSPRKSAAQPSPARAMSAKAKAAAKPVAKKSASAPKNESMKAAAKPASKPAPKAKPATAKQAQPAVTKSKPALSKPVAAEPAAKGKPAPMPPAKAALTPAPAPRAQGLKTAATPAKASPPTTGSEPEAPASAAEADAAAPAPITSPAIPAVLPAPNSAPRTATPPKETMNASSPPDRPPPASVPNQRSGGMPGRPNNIGGPPGHITATRIPSRPSETFKAGDHVVYPTHGVGQVQGIESVEVAGFTLKVIVVTFEENRMTLRVPENKASSSGLRKLATPDNLKEALDTLKGRARIKRTMWSRRAQEYEAKINSGDLVQVAEVVRDLYRNAGQPDQSFSERQIYEQALDRLASEVGAIEKTDKIATLERLQVHLKN